jgi:hypothetical protein
VPTTEQTLPQPCNLISVPGGAASYKEGLNRSLRNIKAGGISCPASWHTLQLLRVLLIRHPTKRQLFFFYFGLCKQKFWLVSELLSELIRPYYKSLRMKCFHLLLFQQAKKITCSSGRINASARDPDVGSGR